jgi:hypothetical protein
VRKSGEKVRITAQLIKAADGSHLWSETYDRTLDDIFVVQDDIAGEVVKALKVTLLGTALTTRSKPQDSEAYNLALQGRFFLDRRGQKDLEPRDLQEFLEKAADCLLIIHDEDRLWHRHSLQAAGSWRGTVIRCPTYQLLPSSGEAYLLQGRDAIALRTASATAPAIAGIRFFGVRSRRAEASQPRPMPVPSASSRPRSGFSRP